MIPNGAQIRQQRSKTADPDRLCPAFSGKRLHEHQGGRNFKEADVSAGSFQNIFRTKDGVLTELIGMMFSRQFGAVRPLAANAPSPVYLYAVETALQLAMTELSENLRDIYVEAYTFPATAEIIHRSTTAELQAAFSAFMISSAKGVAAGSVWLLPVIYFTHSYRPA